jgi:hypothetical protein
MTVWIALGYIIFAAIVFRPRGIVGIVVLGLLVIAAIGPILRNYAITDSPFGTAFLTLYNGLGGGTEDTVMRNVDPSANPLVLDGLISKILQTTLLQATEIITFLGGIIIAPLFFLSLLHPFKRTSIARFRWAIVLMWVTTAFGLAFFGVTADKLDPNQLHLLFAPIMTAYGLAFISILWSRLDFVTTTPMLRNVHHILIIAICALPLVLALPSKVRLGMTLRDRGGVPHWPPYYAPALNSSTAGLKGWVDEKQVVFSDQPWAVAWYADRMSIWLPPTREGFLKLEETASNLQTPTVGILISPSSHGSGTITEVMDRYKDFSPLVLNGRVMQATYPPGIAIYDKNEKIQDVVRRYQYPQRLVGMDMLYYSDRVIRSDSRAAQ